LCRVP